MKTGAPPKSQFCSVRYGPGAHLKGVTWPGLKQSVKNAIQNVQEHHTIQVSAALSYYFFLALFPVLIVLSILLSWFPVPNLFNWVLDSMARVLPAQTMNTVNSVLHGILTAHRGTWFSVGLLGMLWVASAAFDALIEALNIAYNIKDNRPFWKTRLLAFGLGAICGILFLVGLLVVIVGPRFGDWLAAELGVPRVLAALWGPAHWMIAVAFTVLAVELLYFLAPCETPEFLETLPGAIITVGAWLGLSELLGVYFGHFANYSRVYGTLGGFIIFMNWLQWTSFAFLLGAEMNAEFSRPWETKVRAGNIKPNNPHNFEAGSNAA
ncbi:MAG: YihY/virulence factor BrkB family protein [Candidatus Sulfotelmatobacter sp.]